MPPMSKSVAWSVATSGQTTLTRTAISFMLPVERFRAPMASLCSMQTGGNGKDLLDGSLGTQTLIGNNGADALIGGPGDVLTGGLGPDTFTFKGNFGHNEITDYSYPDLIQLDKSEF